LVINVSASQTHLYVDDVDASWNRAVEAGAGIRTPLFDAYWGDRTGVLVDTNGHLWSLASKIENLSKEEIASRAKAEFAPIEEYAAELEYVDQAYAVEVPALEQTVAA